MNQCENETVSKKVFYFNAEEDNSIYQFSKHLNHLIEYKLSTNKSIVLLCIGSDRATGDCLGPIVGYKLAKLNYPDIHIYGTLANPVHAKNLDSTLALIKHKHHDCCIIAIDASLGSTNHIGYVTLGIGSLYPGIGVDKDLPEVGDIFITGIVNISGLLNQMLLQTTRLDTVMRLADYICTGIRYCLFQRYHSTSRNTHIEQNAR